MYLKKAFGGLCLLSAVLILSPGCGSKDDPPAEFRMNFYADVTKDFAQVDQVRSFQFPKDHGAHEEFRNEWWYLTSILRTAEGRVFGTQFTLFRQALTPNSSNENPWQTGQIYLAHFAVSDIQSREHRSFERMARGHKRIAGVIAQPFRLYMDDWVLKSVGEQFDPLHLQVREQAFEVKLELSPTKPIVLHGNQGWSRKGPENATYYYSIPRLASVGTITTPEGEFAVKGNSWLDREWMSALLSDDHLGWVWFSLQLEDGRDIVLFRLRNKTPEKQEHGVGLVIAADGSTYQLDESDWSAEPSRYWKGWPIAWDVTLEKRNYMVRPLFDDQLMQTTIRYWEGVVLVMEGDETIGEGYLELTGY